MARAATVDSAEFGQVFARLKELLEPYTRQGLRVTADGPAEYTVVGPVSSKFPQAKEGLFFAGVRLGRAYVSYHLMPLYVCPALQDEVSAGLQRRKQGKACFNFKSEEALEAVVDDLAVLTARGLAAYHENVYP